MDINVLTIILTIIGANIATLAIFTNVINKRIDDFRDLLNAKLEPITRDIDSIKITLNNHITDTNKKIEALTKKVDYLLAQKK